jgi:hypothetical protein
MLKNIIEAERDQDADCTRIDAAVRLAEQDIAVLRCRQLGPDEAHKKWSAIRDQTILAVRDVRRNIVKRADEAKEAHRGMIEAFFRERGACPRDDKGRPLPEYSAILQEIPTKGLLDHLRYLIQIGDFVRAQSIRAAFELREDRYRYVPAFEKILAQLAFAESGDLDERLARIRRSADEVDAKITDLFFRHITTMTTADRIRECPR